MNSIAELLQSSGIDAIDARVLLRAVLNVNDAYLIAHARAEVSTHDVQRFQALAARRAAGEPVAYLVGEREFYAHVFGVTPAVLIPRPETELLVELAVARRREHVPLRVLDLGTGSGCIAISIALALPNACVVAIDYSHESLAIARANAQRLKARNVEYREGDWYAPVVGERFDMIVSNPPYVAPGDAHLTQGDLRFEPRLALEAGGEGYDALRAVVIGAPTHLTSGGWLLFEHGHDQAAHCRSLLTQVGFSQVQSWRDLAGIERVSGGSL